MRLQAAQHHLMVVLTNYNPICNVLTVSNECVLSFDREDMCFRLTVSKILALANYFPLRYKYPLVMYTSVYADTFLILCSGSSYSY